MRNNITKFIYITILALMLIIPVECFAKTCTPTSLEEKREKLKQFKLIYTFVSEKGEIDNNFTGGKTDITNKIKIEFSGLPEDFYLMIYDGAGKEIDFVPPTTGGVVYLKGGVYKIDITDYECGETIKSLQVFIPIYNKNNKKNVWFDGTYEQKTNPNNREDDKNKINPVLIVIIVVMLVVIVGTIIYAINRKKKMQEWEK